ncbi:MAG TPA: hypothetical protein VFR09_03120 [Alphaproteobacteria bacterium]|nr:hypothetical protein [Alphaproteobacteria bacterium]
MSEIAATAAGVAFVAGVPGLFAAAAAGVAVLVDTGLRARPLARAIDRTMGGHMAPRPEAPHVPKPRQRHIHFRSRKNP